MAKIEMIREERGYARPGTVMEVSADRAQRWVAAGRCKYVGKPPASTDAPPEPELSDAMRAVVDVPEEPPHVHAPAKKTKPKK